MAHHPALKPGAVAVITGGASGIGLAAGDVYTIYPDKAADEQTDRRRTSWGAADITKSRPALSRWHPDYKDAFGAFMAKGR